MQIELPSSSDINNIGIENRLNNIELLLHNIQTQTERQNYVIQSMFNMINTINNTLIMFHNYYKEIMYPKPNTNTNNEQNNSTFSI